MEKTEPKTESKEEPKHNNDIEGGPPRPWYAKLIIGLLFGICALTITNLFEHLAKPKDVSALIDYQTQIITSLNGLRPLRLYNLYVAAMGYGDLVEWEQSDAFKKELSRCEAVADNALRAYLNLHPDVGVAVETENHRYYCQYVVKPKIAAPAGSASIELDKLLNSQPSLDLSGCWNADTVARDAGRSCVRDIAKPVGYWAASWSDWLTSIGIKGSPIRWMALAVVPFVALADVIWHNFLVFNSVAVLHWALLALGFWGAYKVIGRLALGEDAGFGGSLLVIALFPLITVFFCLSHIRSFIFPRTRGDVDFSRYNAVGALCDLWNIGIFLFGITEIC